MLTHIYARTHTHAHTYTLTRTHTLVLLQIEHTYHIPDLNSEGNILLRTIVNVAEQALGNKGQDKE